MIGSKNAPPPLSVEKSHSEKEPIAPQNGTATTSTKKNSRQSRPAMTSLLIALIGIGAAVYAIYANVQLRQETRHGTNTLITQINLLKDQQLETKALFENQTIAKTESDNILKNQLLSLEKQLHSTRLQSHYQPKDWILLKTRYYLELADINLHWSNNLDTTIALLEQANLSLASVQDHPVFNIRQAITKEITQLKSRPKLDIVGLLSQLDAIESLTLNLSLKSAIPMEAKTTFPSLTKPSAWSAHFKQSLDILQTLIVVRHHDKSILPLPSPIDEAMLRESIQLNLQQAKWAILQRNEAIYQRALALVIQQINQSVKAATDATNTIMQQLKTLQEIHLTEQKPVLDESLQLLNQLIDSKNTAPPAATGENPS